MRPLVLRDIAESWKCTNPRYRGWTTKYMHTPRAHWSSSISFPAMSTRLRGRECSATAIRALIKKLITAELPKKASQ